MQRPAALFAGAAALHTRTATRRQPRGLYHRALGCCCWNLWTITTDYHHLSKAFVLRVMDCMSPAARSLTGFTLVVHLAGEKFPLFDAAFVASLHEKWTAAAMVQMRRARNLLDVVDSNDRGVEEEMTRWRTDVAEHGLKECALPLCDKRASRMPPQGGIREAVRGGRSMGRCTGRSTSPSAAQPRPHRRLRMARAPLKVSVLFSCIFFSPS